MSIPLIRNYAIPTKKTATPLQPWAPKSDFEAKPIERTEEDRRLEDKVTLSWQARHYQSAGALSYTLAPPEACATVEPPKALRVREQTQEEIQFNPFNYSSLAQDGFVEDYFFELNTNFIQRQAESVLSSGEIDTDQDSTIYYFAHGLKDWFAEEDFDGLMNSLEKLCHEYADRMQTGGNLNLRSLETTFSIRGEDVKLGQILDMRDMAKVFAGKTVSQKSFSSSGWGTQMYLDDAGKGIFKAAAQAYSKTLPGALGQEFSDGFTRLWNRNQQTFLNNWTSSTTYKNAGEDSYFQWVANMSSSSYEMFSNLDTSSASAMQADFQSKLNQFGQMMDDRGVGHFREFFQKNITTVFKTAFSALF